MSKDEILKMIEIISPHAREYVRNCYENNEVEIIYELSTQTNKGVFLKAEDSDCSIFYASFLNETNMEEVSKVIKDNVKKYITRLDAKELCFNVFGENFNIIELVRKLGFQSDMEGYHLEYRKNELKQLTTCGLIIKGFERNMLSKYIDLFEQAYYQLNMENGWNTDYYSKNEEQFQDKLVRLNGSNQICSFWLHNELIGAYIFESNYITDIVVKPGFQNKGYGSFILNHCIQNMKVNKSIEAIRLRVAKSNVKAKQFYERNDFIRIACFAEHTYVNNFDRSVKGSF